MFMHGCGVGGHTTGCNLDDPLRCPPEFAHRKIDVIPQIAGLSGHKVVENATVKTIERVAGNFAYRHIICGHGCYP
ncbi:MAG: hypothetical protein V4805_03910 [Pseudomonadota bacterium]